MNIIEKLEYWYGNKDLRTEYYSLWKERDKVLEEAKISNDYKELIRKADKISDKMSILVDNIK